MVGCRRWVLDEQGVAWASRRHQLGRHWQSADAVERDQQQQQNQSWNSARIGIVAAEAVTGILLEAEAEVGSAAGAEAGSAAEAAAVAVHAAAALLRSRSTGVVAGAVDEVVEPPALVLSMDEASGTKLINIS